jgi:hypothetical protein
MGQTRARSPNSVSANCTKTQTIVVPVMPDLQIVVAQSEHNSPGDDRSPILEHSPKGSASMIPRVGIRSPAKNVRAFDSLPLNRRLLLPSVIRSPSQSWGSIPIRSFTAD